MALPDISIIVPNWNTRELLQDALDSIEATRGALAVETVVVDNASTDGSTEMVRGRGDGVRLVSNPTNLGFARAANLGAASTSGPYLLFLNSDARLMPGALDALGAVAAAQARAALVGAQLRNADGTFQASYAAFPTLGSEFLILSGIGRLLYGPHYPSYGPDDRTGPRTVDWVGGACLLVRRTAFAAVGGFDEGYFMYAEEVDLCARLRSAGWETWYQPAATVVHLGRASTRHRPTTSEAALYRSRVRFFRRHHGAWPATLLAAQIYAFTLVKHVAHGTLRAVTRGHRGRPVVPLRDLALLAETRH